MKRSQGLSVRIHSYISLRILIIHTALFLPFVALKARAVTIENPSSYLMVDITPEKKWASIMNETIRNGAKLHSGARHI